MVRTRTTWDPSLWAMGLDLLSGLSRMRRYTSGTGCERGRKENGLKPLNERLQIAQWDRKQAASATAAARAAEREASEPKLKNTAGQRIITVKSTKLQAEPNSITQRTGPHGGTDRNFYGTDGRQTLQISNYGHGHKKEESMGKHGEHAHDYTWDADGSWIRSEARELHDDERRDNDDFL